MEGVNLEPVSEEIRTKLEVPDHNVKDFELQVCFRGTSDAKLAPRSSEVAEVRLFELCDLENAMHDSPEEFTPWFRERAQDIGLFD